MELRVLQYFLAIAREESISGAAEYLHITQPTLSRQMKELEEEFGKQLFTRGNRKITLTEDGMLLRKRAEEIVSLVEKTESEMTLSDSLLNGHIYIGGGETEAMRLIAKAIEVIQKDHPHIIFHLYSGNEQDVTERLNKGLLDFGILIEPSDTTPYDFIKLPVHDVWGVFMRKDSPLAKLDYVTPQDIKDLPLICSNQEMIKNEISGWMGRDYNKLNIIATYNLLFNASLLVSEGHGYALGLDGIINTSDNSHLCFKPLEPRLEADLVLVWKKYQVFSKASECFLKTVQKEFQSIQK